MSEETDNVAPEESAAPVETSSESLMSERPTWLPEKFKTPEDLVSSYSQLESKLGKSQEEIRQQVMQELEAEVANGVPETAGDYTIPENIPEELSENSDFLNTVASLAHKLKLNQEEFNDALGEFAELVPKGPDLNAERQKLGENAGARIEAVGLWANKFFPEDLSNEILRIGQTAEGVMVLETVMQKLSSENPLSSSQTKPTYLDEGELRSMMQDPRYWHPTQRDRSFIKQVDEGFSKLYK